MRGVEDGVKPPPLPTERQTILALLAIWLVAVVALGVAKIVLHG
jgi:hypothetical protein